PAILPPIAERPGQAGLDQYTPLQPSYLKTPRPPTRLPGSATICGTRAGPEAAVLAFVRPRDREGPSATPAREAPASRVRSNWRRATRVKPPGGRNGWTGI